MGGGPAAQPPELSTHVLGGMTGHGMGLAAICGQTIARSCHRELDAVEQRRLALLDAARLTA